MLTSLLTWGIGALLTGQVAYAATLEGSANITPQDYYGLPAAALANNPPACGMPYNQLNLARITAVQNMRTDSTCNLCLKVSSSQTGKSIYVLAVDMGGSGLDLSIPAFEYLFNQRYDASPAKWETVDDSYCTGIYTPGKKNPNQGIDAGSGGSQTSPATTKTPTTTKTHAPKTTTTHRTTTTTTSATPTTTSKSKTKSKTKTKSAAKPSSSAEPWRPNNNHKPTPSKVTDSPHPTSKSHSKTKTPSTPSASHHVKPTSRPHRPRPPHYKKDNDRKKHADHHRRRDDSDNHKPRRHHGRYNGRDMKHRRRQHRRGFFKKSWIPAW
ncbi:uncharacterized protein BYT42DRAFT_558071 [Radiomyces spectabilis]|uniref:uncharacterized protein n=1 Tax=Radiomyces spectabilis TaxID=64574 RepID=UPI00221F3847|nr:uncharacterized protein BYT42DRAFT_558071 [Radiomyces spectabilis]KAI8391785.1 hypothetical protein BYT42DRAFT_558071 [Radiomyces spectabilis]